MGDAVAPLLEKLRRRGVQFEPYGDSVRFRPINALTSDERAIFKRNKGAVLSVLYREKSQAAVEMPATGSSNEHLGQLEESVRKNGYVLLWSDVLNDLVAMCQTNADAERVPRGVVAYTVAELSILFGDYAPTPSESGLRLIHRAKKLGGGTVMSSDSSHP